MGFDDLDEAIEDQDTEDADVDGDDSRTKPTFDESPTTTMSETQTETAATSDDQDDIQSGPAFPFDEADQNPLYARPEAWDAFDDMLDLALETELRDRGIRDASKSEKHDAALRILAEHAEEIADQIESERI